MELQINTFKDTEKILYSYKKFENTIKNKQEYVDELLNYGPRKRSGSVIPTPSSGGTKRSQEEIVEDMVNALNLDIFKIEFALSHIDRALQTIKDDEYYEVIELKYFEQWSLEEIADALNKSIKTISKHRSRLIREISILLFTSEVIDELMQNSTKNREKCVKNVVLDKGI